MDVGEEEKDDDDDDDVEAYRENAVKIDLMFIIRTKNTSDPFPNWLQRRNIYNNF